MSSVERWHRAWQAQFPRCEVVIGEHRADIVAKDGTVIELQHSPISEQEIIERERHYQRMIWVLDFTDSESFQTRKQLSPDTYTFRWYNPRRTFKVSRCPIYIDFGGSYQRLFRIINVYWNNKGASCAGYGRYETIDW